MFAALFLAGFFASFGAPPFIVFRVTAAVFFFAIFFFATIDHLRPQV